LSICIFAAVAAADVPCPAGDDPRCPRFEDCLHDQWICASCRAEPDTKTVKTVCYSLKEEPYCFKKCPSPLCPEGWWGNGETCAACEDTPRFRRKLLKRETSRKVNTFKCAGVMEPAQCARPQSAPLSAMSATEPPATERLVRGPKRAGPR